MEYFCLRGVEKKCGGLPWVNWVHLKNSFSLCGGCAVFLSMLRAWKLRACLGLKAPNLHLHHGTGARPPGGLCAVDKRSSLCYLPDTLGVAYEVERPITPTVATARYSMSFCSWRRSGTRWSGSQGRLNVHGHFHFHFQHFQLYTVLGKVKGQTWWWQVWGGGGLSFAFCGCFTAISLLFQFFVTFLLFYHRTVNKKHCWVKKKKNNNNNPAFTSPLPLSHCNRRDRQDRGVGGRRRDE